MSLKHIVLALTKEPVSGYDLNRVIEETIRHFWAADQAQLYRTLKQLEDSALVTMEEREPDRGPSRKVYCRTAKGREALVRWLQSDPALPVERSAYIAQLVFLHEAADLSVTLNFLQGLRQRFAGSLQTFHAIEADEPKAAIAKLPLCDFHGMLGLRMAIDVSEARLAWCDWAIGVVKRRMRLEAR